MYTYKEELMKEKTDLNQNLGGRGHNTWFLLWEIRFMIPETLLETEFRVFSLLVRTTFS
jgi:hypothetical protein